jgi:3-phenylpropionate/trans-cinnamate dioxygenase ferredoxin component
MNLPGVKPPMSGKGIRVTVDGNPVAVFNVGGLLYGVDAKCTHVGGPLDQGSVDGNAVRCPLHGSEFDLRTGAVVRGPATRPLRTYRVRVETDGLTVEPT